MLKLELTREEANKLEMFLLMTTKFRNGEVEALESLVARMKENGDNEQTIKTTEDNIEFWKEQRDIMDALQKRIYNLLVTPNL